MTVSRPRVIVIGKKSDGTLGVIQTVRQHADVVAVIWESLGKKKRFSMLWRRTKRLGILYLLGRIALALYVKLIEGNSWKSHPLHEELHCDEAEVLAGITQHTVASANAAFVVDTLQSLEHDLVVVSGTTILRSPVLEAGTCFVNLHAGITPKYRGAHGAIWAVLNDDFDNVGETLHFIDKGIDTGGIIAQRPIKLDPDDTYRIVGMKYAQAGKQLLSEFLQKHRPPYKNAETLDKGECESRLYYSPTLKDYLRFRRILKATANSR